MFKKNEDAMYKTTDQKPMLPEEKIKEVVRLMDSGTDESIKKINEMLETYKFTHLNVTAIIKLAPISRIFNINLNIIKPKAVVRVMACCVNVIHKSRDERLKFKCKKILDLTCERLHMINFGKEEFLELAEIDDSRISEYVEATSNSWDVQTKIVLPRDKTQYVVQLLESGEGEKAKELNDLIELYEFSYNKLMEILKMTPLDKLLTTNTNNLNPKIFVRVIACCVRVFKEEHDADIIKKFSRIFDFVFDKMQQINLDIKEYLELAKIDDSRIRSFVEKSNHYEVQAALSSQA